MTTVNTDVNVTNEQVAQDIKVTNSMVSRIRSGTRHPGYDTMLEIERAYNWSVADQLKARASGTYAKAFEYELRRTYVR